MKSIFRKFSFLAFIVVVSLGVLVGYGFSDFLFGGIATAPSTTIENVDSFVDPIRQNAVFNEPGDVGSVGTKYYDVYFMAQSINGGAKDTNNDGVLDNYGYYDVPDGYSNNKNIAHFGAFYGENDDESFYDLPYDQLMERINANRDSTFVHVRYTYQMLGSGEDYFEELTSVTWRENNGYVVNNKLGYLHRYIMEKWYGEKIFDEMTKRGWVVDHMNNNGFDCRICNLEFLAPNPNIAKGHNLDIEAEEQRHHIALNLFKDFSTGLYQISIVFNDNVYLSNGIEKIGQPINSIFLLYDCDYRLVINDAEQILLEYKTNRKFRLDKLNYIDIKYELSTFIDLSEQEFEEVINGNRMTVERDGKTYLIIGKNNYLISAHYKEGWNKK